MASPQAQSEYIADAAEVVADLKEDGYQLSFGVKPEPADGRGARQTYTEVGKSQVFDLDWDKSFSDDVQAADIFLICSNETDLESCEYLIRGGKEYRLVTVKPFKPDDITVVYYEVQARH